MTSTLIGQLPQFSGQPLPERLRVTPGTRQQIRTALDKHHRPRQTQRRGPGPESLAQQEVITWARRMIGVKGYAGIELLHAIPNGAFRNKATAGRLKAEGVLPGVPDLLLPVRRKEHPGLYIEMKAPGGALSEAQATFLHAVEAQGYDTFIAFSPAQAITKLTNYLTSSRHPIPVH